MIMIINFLKTFLDKGLILDFRKIQYKIELLIYYNLKY